MLSAQILSLLISNVLCSCPILWLYFKLFQLPWWWISYNCCLLLVYPICWNPLCFPLCLWSILCLKAILKSSAYLVLSLLWLIVFSFPLALTQVGLCGGLKMEDPILLVWLLALNVHLLTCQLDMWVFQSSVNNLPPVFPEFINQRWG